MSAKKLLAASNRLAKAAAKVMEDECDSGIRYGTLMRLCAATVNYEEVRAAHLKPKVTKPNRRTKYSK